MEVKYYVSGVDKNLRCVFLRCVAADEVGRTVYNAQSLTWSQVKEGKYSGLINFGSFVSTVNMLR